MVSPAPVSWGEERAQMETQAQGGGQRQRKGLDEVCKSSPWEGLQGLKKIPTPGFLSPVSPSIPVRGTCFAPKSSA